MLCRIWVYGYFLQSFSLCSFLTHVLPNLRIPTKVSSSHSCVCATHWISRKDPPRSPPSALLYMLLIIQFRPPLCVISPQHQPLINPNSSKNTKPTMTQSLVQWKTKKKLHIFASSSYTICNNFNNQKSNLYSFGFKLHFLSSPHIILPPVSITCLQRPCPPMICCQSVSHNT